MNKSRIVLLLVAGVLAGACNGILDVEVPGRVQDVSLDNPTLAPTLVASAQGDFECAFSEFVHTTGLWANEFINASAGAEVNGWGARLPTYESGTGVCPTASSTRGAYATYLPLHIARHQADGALARLEGWSDQQVANRTSLMSTAAAYAGYTYALLGEAYCSVALDDGPLVTPAASLALAEERFTRAIELASASNNTNVLNLARVGRARVRLDLGKKAEAASDAALIPAGFVYNSTYSTSNFRRNNTVVLNNNVNFHVSVDPAYRNLMVGTVPDSRVKVTDAGRRGNDALTPLWVQGKYANAASPIPLATWDEAQLIIAEAKGGEEAVAAINRIRTKYQLPQFSGGDATMIQEQIIEERRRTLFLDGHRIGDKLRLRIPFPTGLNHKGVAYGNQTCLPLPAIEMNGRS